MTGTQKQTVKWLSRVRHIQMEIGELSEAKLAAWNDATVITAQLTGMPGSPSKNPHKFEKYAEIDGNLVSLLEQKQDALKEILTAINTVEDSKLRVLLLARYVNCKSWNEVSLTLGYPPTLQSDSVYRLHRFALDKIYEKNLGIIVNNS